MGVVIAVVVIIICLLVVSSLVLGRASGEVESPREDEYVELEGSMIRYRISGGGPPVLLVHGWLSSSRVWADLAERLESRFTVYSLDLRGFGESDKPFSSGYGIRHGSRILYAFCAHFGIREAAVVGHDLGGDMAVKLAADHPDAVGRLVLVSVPAEEDQIDLPTPLWLATLPLVGPAFYVLGQRAGWVRRAWMRPFVADRKALPPEVIEDAGRSTPAAVRQALAAARRELSRGRLVRRARTVKVPVLFVAGEEDYIVNPEAANDWSGSMSQTEARIIENCGHMPMIEYPEGFGDLVLEFLSVEPGETEEPLGFVAPGYAGEGGEETMDFREEPGEQEVERPAREPLDEVPEGLFEWPPDFEKDPGREERRRGKGTSGS